MVYICTITQKFNILYKKDNYLTMKITNMPEKELIISLLKDNLTNIRLVYGLTELGLDASDYFLRLDETIFKLMGISTDDDTFFEEYVNESRTISEIDIFKHPELLNRLAHSLYHKLNKKYKSQNK